MTVSDIIRKRDHLINCIQTLRIGNSIDEHVLINFLQEYHDLLGRLSISFEKEDT